MIQYIVFIGVALQVAGISAYIRDTMRGKTKPNKVSWLIWGAAPLIASIAAFTDGVRWAVFPIFIDGITALLVFFASLLNPESYWKLEKFDYICGVCSLFAIILWQITKEPLVAVIFSILSYLFAGIPTFVKAWKFPETESVGVYFVGFLNALSCFFAFKMFSFSEMAFPIYLVVECSYLIFAIQRGNKKIKNPVAI